MHGAGGHTVLFAESDAELVTVAGDLLARRLLAGGVVIVMATADHSRLLEERARAAGVDPAQARREDRLIVRDAAETLERLTPEDAFDPVVFDQVVGTIVRSAATRGPVLAFGEMVGLLWDKGRVQEAIELESAWNGLLEETAADLVCAYPRMLVDGESIEDLLAVCALHSSALDDASFERVWRFPAEIARVTEARRLAIAALRARGLSGVTLEDSELAIAELTANAVVHGRSSFSLTVRLDAHRLRVEVADASPHVPIVRVMREDATSGRGLHLLGALADRWGIDETPGGKVVWMEVVR